MAVITIMVLPAYYSSHLCCSLCLCFSASCSRAAAPTPTLCHGRFNPAALHSGLCILDVAEQLLTREGRGTGRQGALALALAQAAAALSVRWVVGYGTALLCGCFFGQQVGRSSPGSTMTSALVVASSLVIRQDA
jgi:hypothetical protein